MKKRVATAISFAILSGAANAADLPSRKEPALAPVVAPAWTGFYAGLNAGYGWGTNNQAGTVSAPLVDTTASTLNLIDASNLVSSFRQQSALLWGSTALANTGRASVQQGGFIGGGQLGYNYQYSERMVLGLETDFQGSTMRGNGHYTGASQDAWGWANPKKPAESFVNLNRTALGFGDIGAGVDWLGTVRGRIGVLATPQLLLYGTGGFAYGGVRASANNAIVGGGAFTTDLSFLNTTIGAQILPGGGNYSGMRAGWTAGGGVEWMLTQNWSLKAEALYYSLGSATFNSSPVVAVSPAVPIIQGLLAFPGTTVANIPSTRVNFEGVIARAGLNYHLNFAPAPVVMKY